MTRADALADLDREIKKNREKRLDQKEKHRIEMNGECVCEDCKEIKGNTIGNYIGFPCSAYADPTMWASPPRRNVKPTLDYYDRRIDLGARHRYWAPYQFK